MTKNYNENYIREAAYYNWQNAGCPNGQDEYFWNQAIYQLYGTKSSCGCKTTKSCSTKTSSTKSSSTKTNSVKTKSTGTTSAVKSKK